MTGDLRSRVDAVLTTFLDERLRAVDRLDPAARPPIQEIGRLLAAGGKRIRPVFCYWGFRAAGGEDRGTRDEPIVHAAAALELLHTMALVHDDLIDGAKERRGVPSTAAWFAERAEELEAKGEPTAFGEAMAVLVGDLSAVLADHLLLESGFSPDALADALAVYHPMREEMAIGQFLALAGSGHAVAPDRARRVADLKGGGYTVEGPLRIGAALAGGTDAAGACLSRFGRPLGEAFQLRDDLTDGDAAPGVTLETVNERIADAKAALDPEVLVAEAVPILRGLADEVAA
ncbi:MAG TPA: polyprenyl synthetase family protein [Actinomycetota bacterium]